MKVAIMQPYFLPYLGYLQLIKSVDIFVVYDTIQYTKKGWINRNRYYLDYNKKTLRKLEQSYKNAPNFAEVFPLISKMFLFDESDNLFDFIFNSLELLTDYLEIETPLIKSSEVVGDDTTLKSTNRVVNICKQLSANEYINPIGGVELYDKEDFLKDGLTLNFHKINKIEYNQNSNTHIPYLSILDTIMFTNAKSLLDEYKLI